jgi:hypothetical protein
MKIDWQTLSAILNWQMVAAIAAIAAFILAYRSYRSTRPSLDFVQAHNRTNISLIIATKSKPVEVKKIYFRRCVFGIPIGFRRFAEFEHPRNKDGSIKLVVTSQEYYRTQLPKGCNPKSTYKIVVTTSGGSCSIYRGRNDKVPPDARPI